MKKKKKIPCFLLVEDTPCFVRFVVDHLQTEGIDVFGLIPQEDDVYGASGLTHAEAVERADVIFLDHNMPFKNGDEWLEYWKTQCDFAKKQVIGISGSQQPYLTRQITGDDVRISLEIKRILTES